MIIYLFFRNSQHDTTIAFYQFLVNESTDSTNFGHTDGKFVLIQTTCQPIVHIYQEFI